MLVPVQVPFAQTCVQCENTESDPAIIAVPFHVPAISASVIAAGGGGGAAMAALSTFAVSDFAQATTTAIRTSVRRMAGFLLGSRGTCAECTRFVGQARAN